jgi:hypothetical protein
MAEDRGAQTLAQLLITAAAALARSANLPAQIPLVLMSQFVNGATTVHSAT